MSDGRRNTREDAELADRLFDDVHRYGCAVEALLGNTRQIEQAQRYAGPRFPLYLLGEAEEDEDGNPVHDPERWDAERLRYEAAPDGQNVQRLAKWRQEASELLGEKRPAALAAARHFGHELHPFLFPLEHKPEDEAAGEAMLKAAAALVLDLRAAALLLPYLEPRAEAGDHGPGAEGSAAAGRAGGERAAAAGDDGQAAPEADDEPRLEDRHRRLLLGMAAVGRRATVAELVKSCEGTDWSMSRGTFGRARKELRAWGYLADTPGTRGGLLPTDKGRKALRAVRKPAD